MNTPNPEPIPPAEAPKQPARRLDADGRERPAFLLSFPSQPALDELVVAFERGDFRFVRQNAARVISTATDPQVKGAAQELRRRIDPDPLVVAMLALACALFVFLVAWAYWGGH